MTSLVHAPSNAQHAARALVVAAPAEERKHLEALLVHEHILPVSAPTGETAIAALSKGPFDIVLSNMALRSPWEGLELARWIVSHRPTTGVILLSDAFPWIPANSPIASVPVLLRPLIDQTLIEKVRSLVAGGAAVRTSPL